MLACAKERSIELLSLAQAKKVTQAEPTMAV